eukprot:CAMPEP_0184499974 /NCGR_PEP_ID=MMETSP0113_2-20130426/43222_1 /TAXON_ID=91329 /ORGANISM="Norrisiella sphaerica, Strain BC52" /LENGTH=172 /DNA_ID=CAMNT_0026888137 /DNA_START=96 /DNA_END=611 /DNA_ORIENTATION=+
MSTVRRNASGGIYIDKEELKQAFAFFDTERKGYINLQNLRDTIGIFDPKLASSDLRFLLNNKQSLTEDELYKLLANNTIRGFDPVQEAFKVFAKEAQNEKSLLDIQKLKAILIEMGLPDVTEDDINILKEVAGCEKDQEITFEQFKNMLNLDPSLADKDLYLDATPSEKKKA